MEIFQVSITLYFKRASTLFFNVNAVALTKKYKCVSISSSAFYFTGSANSVTGENNVFCQTVWHVSISTLPLQFQKTDFFFLCVGASLRAAPPTLPLFHPTNTARFARNIFPFIPCSLAYLNAYKRNRIFRAAGNLLGPPPIFRAECRQQKDKNYIARRG